MDNRAILYFIINGMVLKTLTFDKIEWSLIEIFFLTLSAIFTCYENKQYLNVMVLCFSIIILKIFIWDTVGNVRTTSKNDIILWWRYH